MPAPGEHKTVQARIPAYAEEFGGTYIPPEESERRRGFHSHPNIEDGAREMMEQQLMTAQIRVHDLDLDEFSRWLREKFSHSL